jgi:SAM-dependent methyltransferase
VSELIDRERFRAAYRQAVRDIAPFLTAERQGAIARHNLGLHPDRYDLLSYLRASERRYVRAVDRFNDHASPADREPTALDVGGFLGAFPLALARSGARVTLVEEYGYYHGAFDDLKLFLEQHGVAIWPADFTQPLVAAPERFSLVTNMAMLEHLPSSPRQLMENLRRCVADDGVLILEVPNIAYWPNRLRALRGHSIHQAFDLYYASDPPFMGHHREYTVDELRALLEWSGFEVRSIDLHNYSLSLRGGTWFDRAFVLALYLWPTLLFSRCREVILAAARPRSGESAGPDALRLLRSP